ncbi:helix-turn-helix domain-containing protein [bacterium]|nr:helix-turn-helix domain-containing protein [bacterium]
MIFIYSISTYRLLRSRNQVLKALVKKNLQLIDDERKLNEALHIQLSTKKLIRKSTDDEKNLLLYNELTDWLLQGKQYMRKDLTAEIVARELSTNRDYLSRAVSSQQLHFNELINKYRIEEAVKILSNKCDKRNNYNLSIISSDVGFKTMSVFIEAFRKQTGMNPAQFRTTACSDEKVENS